MGWTPSGGRSRPCGAAPSHTADTASASTMTGKSWRGLASGPQGLGEPGVCAPAGQGATVWGERWATGAGSSGPPGPIAVGWVSF